MPVLASASLSLSPASDALPCADGSRSQSSQKGKWSKEQEKDFSSILTPVNLNDSMQELGVKKAIEGTTLVSWPWIYLRCECREQGIGTPVWEKDRHVCKGRGCRFLGNWVRWGRMGWTPRYTCVNLCTWGGGLQDGYQRTWDVWGVVQGGISAPT